MIYTFKKSQKLVEKTTLIILFALFFSIIYVLLVAFIEIGIKPCFNISGLKTIVDYYRPFFPLFKAFIAFSTLHIAIINVNKYITIEAIRSIESLRNRLEKRECKEIHQWLEEPKESNITIKDFFTTDIHSYLGTIEMGSLMVQKGLISIHIFKRQFGYRIANIVESPEIVSIIAENEEYYEDLLWIIKELNLTQEYNKSKKK